MSKQTQLDRFSRQVAAMAPNQRRTAAVAGQRFVENAALGEAEADGPGQECACFSISLIIYIY